MADDGLNTVEGLKIVVDASTEKFANGIADARAILNKFVAEGTPGLATIDGAMMKLGASADFVRGKLGVMLTVVEGLMKAAEWLGEKTKQVAEMTNSQTEAQAALAAWADVSKNVLTPLDDIKNQIIRAGQAARETSADYQQADEQQASWMQSTMVRLRLLSNNVQAGLEGMRETQDKSTKALTGEIDIISGHIRRLQKEIDENVTTRGALSSLFRWLGWESEESFDAEMARLRAKLDEASEMLREKQRALALAAMPDPMAGVDAALDALDKEIAALELKARAYGLAAGEAARLYAQERALAEFRRATEDDEAEFNEVQRALVDEKADQIARLTQAAADRAEAEKRRREQEAAAQRAIKALERIDNQGDREIESINARIRAMNMSAQAAAEESFFQRQMLSARQANLEITDEMVARFRQQASAVGAATEQLRQMKDRMDEIKATGAAVASAIEGQFRAWTQGAEIDVRKMTQSVLSDLARITLQRQVLGPLLGGYGAEGSGMLGSLLNPLFGGARALGGPVEAGREYLVGEEGPERFIPGANGAIVPASATPAINIAIDARGADASIMGRLDRLEADLPGHIVSVMREASERGAA